jgi:hypothetical protein
MTSVSSCSPESSRSSQTRKSSRLASEVRQDEEQCRKRDSHRVDSSCSVNVGNRECVKAAGAVVGTFKDKVSVRYLSAGVSTSDQYGPRGLAYEDLQR